MPISVTGTDGHVPVYNPDERWALWRLSDLYMGTVGLNKFVPKVGDWVKDTDTNVDYEVTALNLTSLVPTLREVHDTPTGEFGDVLLGVGPGTQSDTYRCYIDKTPLPYTLAVDARLMVAGTMAVACKIFRGSVLDGTGEVISNFYDNSGNLLGDVIPLEVVVMPGVSNVAVKTVPVCYTTKDLPDGETVTAVFYAADGHVVSKRQLLIENTGFIRSSALGTKYITHISLKSPFLSMSDPQLIQYPLNVPLNGLNLIGVAHYSDGSTIELPVDQTKFQVFGFENFVSTIVGQEFPIVLKYNLSSGEIVYTSEPQPDKFITANYTATTTNEDGAYTVKLFGYPVWQDGILGYKMEWYMYNLDRQAVFHVTPHVSYNANTQVFDGLLYGATQHLSVSVNLKDVNPSFKSFVHTQTIDVVLLGAGTLRTTNWKVGFDPNQNPMFGIGNHADTVYTNVNLSTINLATGAADQDTWLERLYRTAKPLTDPQAELAAPAPTHFALVNAGADVVLPISQWDQTITLNFAYANNSSVFVKFFKRTADNDIQLAIAALPVYQQN
jgi:hypothetical protein